MVICLPTIVSVFSNDNPFTDRMIFLNLMTIGLVSLYLPPALFLCFTWMGYVFVRQLKETILIQGPRHSDAKSSSFNSWKQTYIEIGDYFCEINGCFGSAMLSIITSFTSRLVHEGFYIILHSQQKTDAVHYLEWLYLASYFKEIVIFLILLYVPTRVEQEVYCPITSYTYHNHRVALINVYTDISHVNGCAGSRCE